MAARVAFLTGINGQDGSYLSELLLEKGYYVYGIIRRKSAVSTGHIDPLGANPRFRTFYGDMTDQMALRNVFDTILAEHGVMGGEGGAASIERMEIYNLAAMSHVKISFEVANYTLQTNTVGALYLLEIARNLAAGPLKGRVRFYQAGTSEMYGDWPAGTVMNEETPFHPVSPYAVSKRAAFDLVRIYREGYGLFACNGILFNHESPRRGENFLTRKVVIAAEKMARGTLPVLEVGNLDAVRDWGHARDYVEAMWRMLQAEAPDDYVVGTGKTHSVREFIERVFAHHGHTIRWEGAGVEEVGLDAETRRLLVRVSPRYFRPMEVPYLCADPTRARERLGWEPRTGIADLIAEMVAAERAARVAC